ncbi:hypothetical protein MIMGU_mgv1a0129451mg, partial [Erythranthe guttata]
MFWALFVLGHD